ncbi:MAG TPA: amidohydrolase [Chloroflexi bacterium]|nr:amidohydrolase [Chloroflexota bacterium]
MPTLTLTNARIFTMDPGHPFASGLVIEEGKITRILSRGEDLPNQINAETIDLGGKTVLPGLIDSHLHLRNYAETLQKLNCETNTIQECLNLVKERVHSTPPGKWILGHGWNHNLWPGGYGTAEDLDQISTKHPIYLTGKSLHVSWANTTALDMAGITRNTPDPSGGILGRDPDGNLTGILFEEAVKIIEKAIPLPTRDETVQAISTAQESLWRMGLTGVHDFDQVPCLEALKTLVDQHRLKLRVLKSIPADYLEEAIEEGIRTGDGSDWLWYGGVKDFMDGALGPQTAAMISPYQGTDAIGMLLKSEDEIYQLGREAASGGLSLAIHAIGDLANRTLLDALARVRKFEHDQGIKALPHRIEHVQILHPEDISRLAALGITASMQPIHATSDMAMADTYWGERTRYAYAPKMLLNQGVRVIFGSDAPVESPNPWLGIHAAVTRRTRAGTPGPDGWHPEGRLSLKQTLTAFTSAAGEAAGKGRQQGRLAPGYWADCIILAEDPFSCLPDELWKIKPLGTMINGEWVWREFE